MANQNKKSRASLENGPVSSPPSSISTASGADKHRVNLTINLRNIPLLTRLTKDEMDQVKKELSVRQYSRRETILKRGAINDSLLFLFSGNIQVIDLTDQGNVIGLSLLAPGDFFGEVALINNTVHTASVIALSEVLVARLPGAAALHLFTHSPSVAQKIQFHLAQKVQRDYKFRALLSINNTSKRIFSFLVLMKQRNADKQELVVNLPTHQEIANMINTSRETVTRTLLMLTQQGIVRKDAHRLIITNPAALKKLVQNA